MLETLCQGSLPEMPTHLEQQIAPSQSPLPCYKLPFLSSSRVLAKYQLLKAFRV